MYSYNGNNSVSKATAITFQIKIFTHTLNIDNASAVLSKNPNNIPSGAKAKPIMIVPKVTFNLVKPLCIKNVAQTEDTIEIRIPLTCINDKLLYNTESVTKHTKPTILAVNIPVTIPSLWLKSIDTINDAAAIGKAYAE